MNRLALAACVMVCSVAWSLSSPAHADFIYDSGVSPTDVVSGYNVPIIGDDFSLATASILDEVRWTGFYYPDTTIPPTDDFTIQLFDYSGSSPSATPLFTFNVGNAVTRVDTGVRLPYIVFDYSASVPATALDPGRYLLSIQQSGWLWSFANGGDGTFVFNSGVWGAQGSSSRMDFTLIGTPAAVPEPRSLVMLGTGAFGLLAFGWHRRRSAAPL